MSLPGMCHAEYEQDQSHQALHPSLSQETHWQA